MSDESLDAGTDFVTALDQASEESLDDLAHYRPNRHGRIDLDCFGKGYRRVPDELQVPRTFPEDGCPLACTQCQRPFVVGEIIHPELDGTRCIPCFKVHWRNFGKGLAAAFRANVDESTRAQAAAGVARMVEAAYAPPDPNAPDLETSMRDAFAKLGLLPELTPEQAAEAERTLRELWDAPLEAEPAGPSATQIALDELQKGIEENTVGRCHKCGSPTANPDMIGAACHSGMAKDPAERCRGYIHPLDERERRERYFQP